MSIQSSKPPSSPSINVFVFESEDILFVYEKILDSAKAFGIDIKSAKSEKDKMREIGSKPFGISFSRNQISTRVQVELPTSGQNLSLINKIVQQAFSEINNQFGRSSPIRHQCTQNRPRTP